MTQTISGDFIRVTAPWNTAPFGLVLPSQDGTPDYDQQVSEK